MSRRLWTTSRCDPQAWCGKRQWEGETQHGCFELFTSLCKANSKWKEHKNTWLNSYSRVAKTTVLGQWARIVRARINSRSGPSIFFPVSLSHPCLTFHFSFQNIRSNIFSQHQTNSALSVCMLGRTQRLVRIKSPVLGQITQPFLDNRIVTYLPTSYRIRRFLVCPTEATKQKNPWEGGEGFPEQTSATPAGSLRDCTCLSFVNSHGR